MHRELEFGADGKTRWALKRQDKLFLVGGKR
jgi:hypothetical protein